VAHGIQFAGDPRPLELDWLSRETAGDVRLTSPLFILRTVARVLLDWKI